MRFKLKDVSSYRNESKLTSIYKKINYVSTENMLSDKRGVDKFIENINVKKARSYEKNDILLSNIRPYFKKIWFATCSGLCSNDVLVIKNKNIVNSKYLYYYLTQNTFFDYAMLTSKGTKMPRGDKNSIMKFEIHLPSLVEQAKIVKILTILDKKIETNNKINDNLEQEIALIYQNSLKKFDSRQISLREVVLKANTGADAITKAPIVDYNTGIRCARVGDMSNNRSHLEWGFTNISNLNYNSYKLNKGDILVTRTASIGLNYLIYNDINAVYNNGLIRLKIDDKQIFPLILFREFKTLNFVNYIKKIESETSVRPNMKIDYLLNYKFKILNNNCQNKVYNIIQPLFLEINKNIEKNFKLIELRDVLLPKLMSGEIDVSNIEI